MPALLSLPLASPWPSQVRALCARGGARGAAAFPLPSRRWAAPKAAFTPSSPLLTTCPLCLTCAPAQQTQQAKQAYRHSRRRQPAEMQARAPLHSAAAARAQTQRQEQQLRRQATCTPAAMYNMAPTAAQRWHTSQLPSSGANTIRRPSLWLNCSGALRQHDAGCLVSVAIEDVCCHHTACSSASTTLPLLPCPRCSKHVTRR